MANGEIPGYVQDGLDGQDVPTLHAIIDYCERRIDELEKPIEPDDINAESSDQIEDVREEGGALIVTKLQQCGKNCGGCPHGPYKWRVTPNGKGGQDWKWLEKA